MRRLFLILIVLISTVLYGFAQSKYSNEFLSLGLGARGLGMANTMCALTDDITSAYWNPAGLTRMDKRYQLSLMHAEYFAGIAKYDYAGVGYKIDTNQSVAFSYIRFGVDNIMNTTQLIDDQGNVDYDRITYFSAADNAFLLSYAYAFPQVPGLSVGANAKIIHRKIGEFARSWGFGLDFGLQYNRKGWQAGVMLRDGTSTFNAWNYSLTDDVIAVFEETGNEIPENDMELTVPALLIGGGKTVHFGKGFHGTFALGLDCTFDGKRNTLIKSNFISVDPHVGMEFDYKRIVFLRAGVGNFQFEPDYDGKQKVTLQINFGVGVNIKDIVAIDYAFTDLGNLSIAQYSHIISLKVGINKFKK